MGKAKKIKVSKSGGEKTQPLADQVNADLTVKQTGRVKIRKRDEDEAEVSRNRMWVSPRLCFGRRYSSGSQV